ncbi:MULTISPECIES: hypothetical protein [Archaeoglobus]|jgi:hypothetical protein|uniref:Uncharacterized protein n=2 Tax=Archaeoglobus fulgidus TaxID=2234 RepID=A0A075WHD8_ARCFL|nr:MULTISPECIES: hypothetical protein [Archaeoglobus]AIG99207.1 hypothetical protein AFULGI_00024920 [Archaeoglobus fulgidus DSM 8774]KUJ93620.1 MAG: hypothetical protein XD40_1171 [Archaeoglobus fulgidus]KUK07319.1 MAG: hypothetical protein XD48_0406 [Archaeoglobus fulgidus]MDI3498812.1 hypothetical protein [Archaeoglobus sp.]
MTPEEFLAAVAAINRYLREKEGVVELREYPRNWKMAARLRE